MSDKLLTAEEIAEMLNVPVTWVRESTRSGAIPCIVLGRYRRYDLAAMLPRLGWAAVRTPPMPYRLLKLAEAHA